MREIFKCLNSQIVRFGLISFSVFFLLGSGTTGSGDAMIRYTVAKALVTRHEIALEHSSMVSETGPDGKIYAFYGVGQSLIFALPELGIQTVCTLTGQDCQRKFWTDLSIGISCQFLFPLISVGGMILLVLCLQELGFRPITAMICAWLLVAASPLLPYAKFHTEENQIFALIFAVIYFALLFYRTGRTCHGIIAAVLCYLPLWFRVSGLAETLPLACLVLFFIYLCQAPAVRLKVFAALTVSGTITLAWLLFYNWYRYGSITETGYLRQARLLGYLDISWYEGLIGPFVNPSKSLLLYSPLLLVALCGVRYAWRQKPVGPALVVTGLAIMVLAVALPSRLRYWGGDTCWGPRYQVAGHTLLLFLAVFAWQRREVWQRWHRRGFYLLLSWGITVQLLGTFFNYNLEYHQGLRHTRRMHLAQWFELSRAQIPLRLRNLWQARERWYTMPPAQPRDAVDEYLIPAFWPWKLGQQFGPKVWLGALLLWLLGWAGVFWQGRQLLRENARDDTGPSSIALLDNCNRAA